MESIIRIRKASFYAYHGVMEEEQRVGGKFEVDLDMHVNFIEAAKKDDLSATIDYEKVYKLLSEISMSKKYYLIESVADIISSKLFKRYEAINKVTVKVRKNNPPIGGWVEYVEVELTKTREEFNNSINTNNH